MATLNTRITEKNVSDPDSRQECGFFIVCDDRSILRSVNTMLLHSGLVGLSDTEGKIHYLIDGRRGSDYVLEQVQKKVLPIRDRAYAKSGYDDALILGTIDQVIEKNDLPATLAGTQIIRLLLFRL